MCVCVCGRVKTTSKTRVRVKQGRRESGADDADVLKRFASYLSDSDADSLITKGLITPGFNKLNAAAQEGQDMEAHTGAKEGGGGEGRKGSLFGAPDGYNDNDNDEGDDNDAHGQATQGKHKNKKQKKMNGCGAGGAGGAGGASVKQESSKHTRKSSLFDEPDEHDEDTSYSNNSRNKIRKWWNSKAKARAKSKNAGHKTDTINSDHHDGDSDNDMDLNEMITIGANNDHSMPDATDVNEEDDGGTTITGGAGR